MPPAIFHCGSFQFPLDRPLIMGIVNVTPDSFSDGGQFAATAAALAHARRLINEGADIIDIGGESTRPGAQAVNVDLELQRVLPVLEGLSGCGAALSVDTQKTEVMIAAISAGADMINDVNAFQAEGAMEVIAAHNVGLCVMHKKGNPATMQVDAFYDDVVTEVKSFFSERLSALMSCGVAQNRIVLDPGFGFGKTLAHNVTLLRRLQQFLDLNVPIMVGLSRKSMLGKITGAEVDERLPASISAAILAIQNGATIVRVHDVAATKQALQILAAVDLHE